MEVQVQLGEVESTKLLELDSIPRKGERIVHDGEQYEVKSVVHEVDGPVAVVVIAELITSDEKKVWFR